MKIGIISFAHKNAVTYAKYIKQHQDASLVGIWDQDRERGMKMSTQFNCKFFLSLKQMLETEIDAVVVCSENTNHYKHIMEAVKAGKHILSESPLATQVNDVQEILHACHEKKVFLQVSYPIRYSPVMQKAKHFIDSGELGEVLAVSGKYRGKMPEGWMLQHKYSRGGAIINQSVHFIDTLKWLLNKEVKSAYAVLGTRFKQSDVEDCGMITLKLDSNIVVTIDPSWSRPDVFPTDKSFSIKLIGTNGNFLIDLYNEYSTFYNDAEKRIEKIHWTESLEKNLIDDFISQLTHKTEPNISVATEQKTMAIIDAVYESANTQQIVLLEDNN